MKMGNNNEQSFWIPGQLPGLNEILYVKASRYRGKWNTVKKQHERDIILLAQEAGIWPVLRPRFRFIWVEPNRKRDPDNIVAGGRKLILDALQAANIIPGDGWKHIDGWSDRWIVGRNNPGVHVIIREMDRE